MIGCPYNTVTPVDSGAGIGDKVLFTDGTTVLNWNDAATASWVSAA